MNPFQKAALVVLRLIAIVGIGIGIMGIATVSLKMLLNVPEPPPVQGWEYHFGTCGIWLATSAVLYVVSKPLAQCIGEDEDV